MRHLTAALAVLIISSFAVPSFAVIKRADLQKRNVLTEEAELLSQVDTISLYLSSDRIVFAPRLTKAGVIEVETTVLSRDLTANVGRLKNYVERIVDTFVSVLKERLPVYAPAVAKSFDYTKDIVFIVNSGVERRQVGFLRGGVWQDYATAQVVAAESPPAIVELNDIRAEEADAGAESAGRKGCGCPARR